MQFFNHNDCIVGFSFLMLLKPELRLFVDFDIVFFFFFIIQAIKEHYLTCEYKGTTYDVLSVDSQRSLQDGILIMVVGFLTGKDNLKRKFSQTFYLAPQDKAYVVVNDMYRFVDEESSLPPTVESGKWRS